MPHARTLNIELRGFVLQHAIRQEALASEILKIIFRIVKNKIKSLGNNSSSFSFKNKIDLLHDLGDIRDEEYKDFEKLLEIRNQFAHNSNCSSFIGLKNEKPDFIKYILKNFPNNEIDEERKLLCSYISLFKKCHKSLIKIKREYSLGLHIDLERYQSYELLNNRFWDWMNQAKEDFEKSWNTYGFEENAMAKQLRLSFFMATVEAFKYKLFSEIAQEVSEGKRLQDIFKRKINESEWKARQFVEQMDERENL